VADVRSAESFEGALLERMVPVKDGMLTESQ
jgi:hypothetical protein